MTTETTTQSEDYFATVATNIAQMSMEQAQESATTLATTIETSYLELGGILFVINKNSWFGQYDSFKEYVIETFGFAERKAKYLISIYEHLVEAQIPWEKVQGIGWTKLKDLAPHLTLENVDEWAEKAKNLSVTELQAMLKAEAGDATNETMSSEFVNRNFKVAEDQAEVIDAAISKAKAEGETEFDNVALAYIAAGYLGGSVNTAAPDMTPIEMLKVAVAKMNPEQALETMADMMPQFDIEVSPAS